MNNKTLTWIDSEIECAKDELTIMGQHLWGIFAAAGATVWLLINQNPESIDPSAVAQHYILNVTAFFLFVDLTSRLGRHQSSRLHPNRFTTMVESLPISRLTLLIGLLATVVAAYAEIVTTRSWVVVTFLVFYISAFVLVLLTTLMPDYFLNRESQRTGIALFLIGLLFDIWAFIVCIQKAFPTMEIREFLSPNFRLALLFSVVVMLLLYGTNRIHRTPTLNRLVKLRRDLLSGFAKEEKVREQLECITYGATADLLAAELSDALEKQSRDINLAISKLSSSMEIVAEAAHLATTLPDTPADTPSGREWAWSAKILFVWCRLELFFINRRMKRYKKSLASLKSKFSFAARQSPDAAGSLNTYIGTLEIEYAHQQKTVLGFNEKVKSYSFGYLDQLRFKFKK